MAEAKKEKKEHRKEAKPEHRDGKHEAKPQAVQRKEHEQKAGEPEAKPERKSSGPLQILEKARKTGKIRIGINETTKAVERGTAKYVAVAADVDPKELTMHLPALCKEKNIPIATVQTKKELGEIAGLKVGAAAIAVVEEGDAKKEISALADKL